MILLLILLLLVLLNLAVLRLFGEMIFYFLILIDGLVFLPIIVLLLLIF